MAMFHRCSRHQKKSGLARVVFGLMIMILGALWLADNIGVLPSSVKDTFLTWQMLVIGIGVINLANREWFSGFVLMFIGAFFLIPEHTHFGFDFTRLFWPLLLIGFGVMIIVKIGLQKLNIMVSLAKAFRQQTRLMILLFLAVEKRLLALSFLVVAVWWPFLVASKLTLHKRGWLLVPMFSICFACLVA